MTPLKPVLIAVFVVAAWIAVSAVCFSRLIPAHASQPAAEVPPTSVAQTATDEATAM